MTDFFNVINKENHKRMLKEFVKMATIQVHMEAIAKSANNHKGEETLLKVDSFTWIDD